MTNVWFIIQWTVTFIAGAKLWNHNFSIFWVHVLQFADNDLNESFVSL